MLLIAAVSDNGKTVAVRVDFWSMFSRQVLFHGILYWGGFYQPLVRKLFWTSLF